MQKNLINIGKLFEGFSEQKIFEIIECYEDGKMSAQKMMEHYNLKHKNIYTNLPFIRVHELQCPYCDLDMYKKIKARTGISAKPKIEDEHSIDSYACVCGGCGHYYSSSDPNRNVGKCRGCDACNKIRNRKASNKRRLKIEAIQNYYQPLLDKPVRNNFLCDLLIYYLHFNQLVVITKSDDIIIHYDSESMNFFPGDSFRKNCAKNRFIEILFKENYIAPLNPYTEMPSSLDSNSVDLDVFNYREDDDNTILINIVPGMIKKVLLYPSYYPKPHIARACYEQLLRTMEDNFSAIKNNKITTDQYDAIISLYDFIYNEECYDMIKNELSLWVSLFIDKWRSSSNLVVDIYKEVIENINLLKEKNFSLERMHRLLVVLLRRIGFQLKEHDFINDSTIYNWISELSDKKFSDDSEIKTQLSPFTKFVAKNIFNLTESKFSSVGYIDIKKINRISL